MDSNMLYYNIRLFYKQAKNEQMNIHTAYDLMIYMLKECTNSNEYINGLRNDQGLLPLYPYKDFCKLVPKQIQKIKRQELKKPHTYRKVALRKAEKLTKPLRIFLNRVKPLQEFLDNKKKLVLRKPSDIKYYINMKNAKETGYVYILGDSKMTIKGISIGCLEYIMGYAATLKGDDKIN